MKSFLLLLAALCVAAVLPAASGADAAGVTNTGPSMPVVNVNDPPHLIAANAEDFSREAVHAFMRRFNELCIERINATARGKTNIQCVGDLLDACRLLTNQLAFVVVQLKQADGRFDQDEKQIAADPNLPEAIKRRLQQGIRDNRNLLDAARSLADERRIVFTRFLTRKGPTLTTVAGLIGKLRDQAESATALTALLKQLHGELKVELATFNGEPATDATPAP